MNLQDPDYTLMVVDSMYQERLQQAARDRLACAVGKQASRRRYRPLAGARQLARQLALRIGPAVTLVDTPVL